MRAVADCHIYFHLPFLSGFQICLNMFNIFRPSFSFSFMFFFSNRKRNVYQSWEISCQSDRPCDPENAPPPPIRTTVLLLFPLLRTIPNRYSRHQDTLSLLLTTTPSLPPSPTPPPCTSPTARSTAPTVTLDVCSSSTSESARGTEMICKRGHSEVKSREKNKLPWFIVQSFPHLVQQRAFVSLFVSFVSDTCCDSWDVIHRRLENLALIASFDVSPYLKTTHSVNHYIVQMSNIQLILTRKIVYEEWHAKKSPYRKSWIIINVPIILIKYVLGL